MSVYQVYESAGDTRSRKERAADLIFVCDSMSRWLLVFGPLWFMAQRQWASLGLYVLVGLVIFGAGYLAGVPEAVVGYGYLALNTIFALEEPMLRGFVLERKGYQFIGVTEGQTRDEAEYRFLAHWLQDDDASAEPDQSGGQRKLNVKVTDLTGIAPALRDARPPRILN